MCTLFCVLCNVSSLCHCIVCCMFYSSNKEEQLCWLLDNQSIKFIDSLATTSNPAVLPVGNDLDDAPTPRIKPHICSKPYSEVADHQQDLIDLISTCQRHIQCSTSYCLCNKQGQQACRFGYPKPLQPQTVIITKSNQSELLTARNNSLINS